MWVKLAHEKGTRGPIRLLTIPPLSAVKSKPSMLCNSPIVHTHTTGVPSLPACRCVAVHSVHFRTSGVEPDIMQDNVEISSDTETC